MISVSGWVLTSFLSNTHEVHTISFFMGKLAFFFATLIVYFFILFFNAFGSKVVFSKKQLLFIGIPTLSFVLLSFTKLIYFNSIISSHGKINGSEYGVLYPFFGIYIIGYFLLSYYIIYRKFQYEKNIELLKLKFILSGFIIGNLAGVFTNLAWPLFINPQNLTVSLYGPLFTVVMTTTMSYAIVRHRLFDITIVIREGLVHFVTLALVLSLYVYLLFLSRDFVTGEYGWDEETTTIAFVLIIAITFEPLRRIIFRFIHSIFVSREKNAKDEVRRMRLLLSTNVQFDSLIEKSLSSLQSFLCVKNGNFMYRDPAKLQMKFVNTAGLHLDTDGTTYHHVVHQPEILVTEEIPYRLEEVAGDERARLEKIQGELQKDGIGMVVPIGEPGELFGLFVFGQKEKSEAFTEDNIRYIKALQPHMTSAIANALMYKQAMQRISGMK